MPDLPDLGMLMISILGITGLGVLCLALMVAGGLLLARSLAERLAVRPEGAPLPMRRPSRNQSRGGSRRHARPQDPQPQDPQPQDRIGDQTGGQQAA